MFTAAAPAWASDPIPTPGGHAAGKSMNATPGEDIDPTAEELGQGASRTRTWCLAPIVVPGQRRTLREEQRVGAYKQPRWATRRLFGQTRVYVRPAGQVSELWGNPTVYLEYGQNRSGPPTIEGKLLLGDEITTRWHWGANRVLERQMGAEREHEYALTLGVSRVMVDAKLALGAEAKLEFVDTADSRFDFASREVLLGPSLRWFPVPQVHVDFAGFFGIEQERAGTGWANTALFEPNLIIGYEF